MNLFIIINLIFKTFCIILPSVAVLLISSLFLTKKAKGIFPKLIFLLSIIILAISYYAMYFEPHDLKIKYYNVNIQAKNTVKKQSKPLRIVQLSDLHVEKTGPYEQKVINTVNSLKPDLIVITGDYANNPIYFGNALILIKQLKAPLGIIAIRGNWDMDIADIKGQFTKQGIKYLQNSSLELDYNGQIFSVICVDMISPMPQWAFEKVDIKTPHIIIGHTPDILIYLEHNNTDLFLCGHTHGGQVCMPFYGPVITLTNLGRNYAGGFCDYNGIPVIVNRGIGMEGDLAPRIRFLCPPEIVVVDINFIYSVSQK